MSMDIENKIKNIIEEKINEKSTLDYKVQEYNLQTNDKWEILKDVIAMLNSEDAIGKDKFIILGIAEKEFYIKGLGQDMRDDNEYQNLFELISPRPQIETGQVFIKDKTIGYIFIGKNNKKRPYIVSRDNEKYCQGTSFIRKGSKNVSLDEELREKMILEKRINNSNFHKIYQEILEQNAIKSELIYTNEDMNGKEEIDPSNNNGKFVIGKGLYEFEIKFDVASDQIARIMNSYGIQVAKIKERAYFFDRYQDIDYKGLDFTNWLRSYGINDLAVIVNKMGNWALIIFSNIESEAHDGDSDLIEFKWKIIQ